MDKSFKIYFNRHRQWLDIHVWETPKEFYAIHGDCVGIYIYDPSVRKPRSGKFGEIHLLESHIDDELVTHELLHFLIDLVRTRNGTITSRNEEAIVSEYGNLVKTFWKKYNKI